MCEECEEKDRVIIELEEEKEMFETRVDQLEEWEQNLRDALEEVLNTVNAAL